MSGELERDNRPPDSGQTSVIKKGEKNGKGRGDDPGPISPLKEKKKGKELEKKRKEDKKGEECLPSCEDL